MFVCTTIVTAAALCTYQALVFNVGKARDKYNVAAPATVGNIAFERVYRVQMNTLEQMAFFLPALWIFAMNVNDEAAAALGALWIAGRIIYARAYYVDASKRHKGFLISAFSAIILLLGGIIGALVRM